MKKLLAFALSVALVLSFTACGGGSEPSESPSSSSVSEPEPAPESSSAPESVPESSSESSSVPEPEPEPEPEHTYRLGEATGFYGGYALLNFFDETEKMNYVGFIDTKGVLQTYIESTTRDYSRNRSGSLYTKEKKTFYSVGPDGTVTPYETNDDLNVYYYGEGYVVTEDHKAGFDAVEWIYHIYDASGKELTFYSSGDKKAYQMHYAGEGIFLFDRRDRELTDEQKTEKNSYGYDQWYGDIYFAQSNTWLNDQLITNSGYAFSTYDCKDGVFMLWGASHRDSQNTHKGEFTYADTKGETKTITVPAEIGQEPYFADHRNGSMLFVDRNSNNIYRYDMAADSWSKYEGKYVDNMMSSSSYYPVAYGENTAITLKGADGKAYIMLLDKDMKDILDAPIPGQPYGIRDGVLYVMDQDRIDIFSTYDLTGKKLAEFSNVETTYNWLEEGIILNKGDNGYEYLKTDGTPAFEIDYSKGKLVTLPEE